MPIGGTAIMLALMASMGGFIFGYDTGQISDILIMEDFKLRFATCSNPTDHNTCEFSTVRSGLIVALLSIGTLAGALIGAPWVYNLLILFFSSYTCCDLDRTADRMGRRYAMSAECVLFCVGVIVQITTTHVWQQIAVGRLISGLAVGALSAAVPMVRVLCFIHF